MKITSIRTRVVEWTGPTVPLPPHFCTNPMDLVAFRQPSMGNFAFHGWVLVEIFTDAGLEYVVEPDLYSGGIIFRTERTGAFFYVDPENQTQARALLTQANYTALS